jgi:hypothetical protein
VCASLPHRASLVRMSSGPRFMTNPWRVMRASSWSAASTTVHAGSSGSVPEQGSSLPCRPPHWHRSWGCPQVQSLNVQVPPGSIMPMRALPFTRTCASRVRQRPLRPALTANPDAPSGPTTTKASLSWAHRGILLGRCRAIGRTTAIRFRASSVMTYSAPRIDPPATYARSVHSRINPTGRL